MKKFKGLRKTIAVISAVSVLGTNITTVFGSNYENNFYGSSETETAVNDLLLSDTNKSENQKFEPGEVIVKLKGYYSQEELRNILSSGTKKRNSNSIIVDEVKDLTKSQKPVLFRSAENETKEKIYLLKLSNENADIFEAIEELKKFPEIEYASPNYIFELENETEDSFNDYFDDDYGDELVMWGLDYVKGPEAWEYCSGSHDVVIGIVDSGVDFDHPDLYDNMWINSGEWGENGELSNNGIDDDGNGYIDDVNGWNFYYDNNETYDVDGHGTHVAGTAAASGNNNQGVYGVAKDCSIASLRITSDPSDEPGGYAVYNYAAVIEALDYANSMNIPVTNNSYSRSRNGIPNNDEDFSEIFKAAIDNYNGLFVASAGNDGEGYDANYPAGYDCDNIISVSGSNRFGNPEYDAFNFDAETVDIAAPGINIWSCKYNTDDYISYNGTSMAVPHVVGTVALLKSFKPNMTSDEIKDCILSTVTKTPGMAGEYFVGSEGIVNAEAALKKAEEMYPSNNSTVGKLKTWNFSSSEFKDLGIINSETTVNGLTIYPDSSGMEVKEGSNKINNREEYTHYLMLNGSIEFDVNGDTDIYITAMSDSGEETINVVGDNDEVLSGGSLIYTTTPNVQVINYTGDAQRVKLKGNNVKLINVTLRYEAEKNSDFTNKNWNFSDSIFDNVGKINEKTVVDGLTLYPDVEFVDRNEAINGTEYSRYLDLKGKGGKEEREISFFASGDTKITITARTVTEERVLQIIDEFGCVIGEMNIDGNGQTESFIYSGNPADIYIRSTKSGIRIYDIKIESTVSE